MFFLGFMVAVTPSMLVLAWMLWPQHWWGE